MRTNVPVEELGNLLEQPVLATLAVHRKDGRILLAPVWFEWEDGGFSIVTWADDVKSRCLKRDPRATVLVAGPESPYPSIELSGEATVGTAGDLMTRTARMARRYFGEEAGAEYAKSFEGVALELVRLVPGNLRTWDFRDDM